MKAVLRSGLLAYILLSRVRTFPAPTVTVVTLTLTFFSPVLCLIHHLKWQQIWHLNWNLLQLVQAQDLYWHEKGHPCNMLPLPQDCTKCISGFYCNVEGLAVPLDCPRDTSVCWAPSSPSPAPSAPTATPLVGSHCVLVCNGVLLLFIQKPCPLDTYSNSTSQLSLSFSL